MILTNKGNAQERTVGELQKVQIFYSDINTVAGLTTTLSTGTQPAAWANGPNTTVGIPYLLGDQLKEAFFYLVTPFVGASITSLTVSAGYNDSSGSSTTAFITAQQILSGASPVTCGCGTGTYNGAGYAALGGTIASPGYVTYTFTAIGANLTALTAGEVDIYIWQLYATDVYL